MNDADKLFSVIVDLLYGQEVAVEDLEWDELDETAQELLKQQLNPGIPPEDLEITLATVDEDSYLLALYGDADADFSFSCLLVNGVPVYKHEN